MASPVQNPPWKYRGSHFIVATLWSQSSKSAARWMKAVVTTWRQQSLHHCLRGRSWLRLQAIGCCQPRRPSRPHRASGQLLRPWFKWQGPFVMCGALRHYLTANATCRRPHTIRLNNIPHNIQFLLIVTKIQNRSVGSDQNAKTMC